MREQEGFRRRSRRGGNAGVKTVAREGNGLQESMGRVQKKKRREKNVDKQKLRKNRRNTGYK